MAIDMISEAPSLVTSPRISFSSDDVCRKEDLELQHQSDSNSDLDFDFCISNTTNTETSSADELFLDGLIRPLQLQERFATLSQTQTLASPPTPTPNQNEILKQNITTSVDGQKDQNKSFWHIRRSTSLHGNKKSSFWSLPRSNSTGSVPNSKNSSTKEGHKQNAQFKQMKNMNSSAASVYTSQKPPLRKNYNNGVRINPVLNVPPTFIPKATANLFGFGSFFANGKQKKSKK